MQFEHSVVLTPGASLTPHGPPEGDPQVVRLPLYGPNAHPVNEIVLAAVSEDAPIAQFGVFLWVWEEGEGVWASLGPVLLTGSSELSAIQSIAFRTWVERRKSREQPFAYVFIGTGGLTGNVRVLISTAFGQPPVQVRPYPGEPIAVEIEGGGTSLEQPLEVVNSPGTALAVELSAPVEVSGDVHVDPSSNRHQAFEFIRALASSDPEVIDVDLDGYPYWSAIFRTLAAGTSASVEFAVSNDTEDPPGPLTFVDVTSDFAFPNDSLSFTDVSPLSVIADTPIMAKKLRVKIVPSTAMTFFLWFKKGNV